MNLKSVLSQLNIFAQCQRYKVPLWQCPQFLFVVMGIIIIVSNIIAFNIGTRYVEDPLMVTFIIILVTLVLFILTVVINQSFERLAETNRMKTEFVSIVSHQLRSPLSNLRWATEILLSGRITPVNEKQLEYLKILKENNTRMLELVSDLLIVSRIEQGKLVFKKENVSLKSIIEKKIEDEKLFAEASNVEIVFKAEEGLPNIFIDPHQIEIVIENLLDNAIRYTKEKGKIEIKLKKKNNNLYCEIKDEGVGIPQHDKKYIFQKFFRSENALKRQTEGSGLGLYIASSIIEKSKGKIGFESQEDIGSTFWFTLPI